MKLPLRLIPIAGLPFELKASRRSASIRVLRQLGFLETALLAQAERMACDTHLLCTVKEKEKPWLLLSITKAM